MFGDPDLDSPWAVLLFPIGALLAAMTGASWIVKGVFATVVFTVVFVLSLATLPVWGPVLVIKGIMEERGM